MWAPDIALGHVNETGGGARNQFGKDFAAAGFEWTPEYVTKYFLPNNLNIVNINFVICYLRFCQEDSDGDGYSNGCELGDPDCSQIALI